MDWEAILSQHPDHFADAISKWLLPLQALPLIAADGAAKASASTGAVDNVAQSEFPNVATLPPLNSVLGTIRGRIEALNGEGAQRL